jgi:hypothetical protein
MAIPCLPTKYLFPSRNPLSLHVHLGGIDPLSRKTLASWNALFDSVYYAPSGTSAGRFRPTDEWTFRAVRTIHVRPAPAGTRRTGKEPIAWRRFAFHGTTENGRCPCRRPGGWRNGLNPPCARRRTTGPSGWPRLSKWSCGKFTTRRPLTNRSRSSSPTSAGRTNSPSHVHRSVADADLPVPGCANPETIRHLLPHLPPNAVSPVRLLAQTLQCNPLLFVCPYLADNDLHFPGIRIYRNADQAVAATRKLVGPGEKRVVVFPLAGVSYPIPALPGRPGTA